MKKEILENCDVPFDFKRNQINIRKRKEIKMVNQKKRRENFLGIFIICFIVLATLLLIKQIGEDQMKAIDTCIANGHAVNRCYKNI